MKSHVKTKPSFPAGPYPDWYKDYLYYKEVLHLTSTCQLLASHFSLFDFMSTFGLTLFFQEAGFGRMSDLAISFHYISGNTM